MKSDQPHADGAHVSKRESEQTASTAPISPLVSEVDDLPAISAPSRGRAKPLAVGKKKKKSFLSVAILIGVAATLSALVLITFKDASVYAKGVDQVMAEKDKWVGRTVRVEGILVRGTLKFEEKPCAWSFDAVKNGAMVHVRFPSCTKPDTLRDDMPDVGVTAEGKLQASGEFLATNVLAKCPSKYEMKDKAPGAASGVGIR